MEVNGWRGRVDLVSTLLESLFSESAFFFGQIPLIVFFLNLDNYFLFCLTMFLENSRNPWGLHVGQ